jgi:hypothetical protein
MLRNCILEVGFLCALLASPLSAQKTFVPATDVAFKISAYKSNWRAGESITLKYRVKNITNTAVFVPQEWEVTCPPNPHVWAAWDQFGSGYGGDCSPSVNAMTIRERMSKEAKLLEPGEHLDGTLLLDTGFSGLKPGLHRVMATLSGWSKEKFSEAERSELAQMGHPFMTGMLADSIRVTLTSE